MTSYFYKRINKEKLHGESHVTLEYFPFPLVYLNTIVIFSKFHYSKYINFILKS